MFEKIRVEVNVEASLERKVDRHPGHRIRELQRLHTHREKPVLNTSPQHASMLPTTSHFPPPTQTKKTDRNAPSIRYIKSIRQEIERRNCKINQHIVTSTCNIKQNKVSAYKRQHINQTDHKDITEAPRHRCINLKLKTINASSQSTCDATNSLKHHDPKRDAGIRHTITCPLTRGRAFSLVRLT